MKKKTLITTVFLSLIMIILFCGCHNKSSDNDDNVSNIDTNSGTSQQSQETGNKNPLTGLSISEKYVNQRPVAVMINNIKLAQPLVGVSKADIIYECLVEGGITRLLAVFKDLDNATQIGSVRSARPYYITLARGLDAFYIHVGGSAQAKAIMASGVVDEFDLGSHSNMMWRDSWRKANLGYEHSALTSGEKLLKGITSSGKRTSLRSEDSSGMKFGEDSQIQSGEELNKFTVTFSGYKSTTFTYDSQEQTYKISQFGSAQTDSSIKAQNSKQNVLVLKINTYNIGNTELKALDLVGKGEGYYMSRGKKIKIKWSKKSENSPLTYTTSSGESLTMLPGQIYVCCIPLDSDIS